MSPDSVSPDTVPTVECETVRDIAGGWLCRVAVHASGPATHHDIRLAWCDHDFWCGGRLAPGDMAEAVVRFLLRARPGETLPARFDAARVRYWVRTADDELRHPS